MAIRDRARAMVGKWASYEPSELYGFSARVPDLILPVRLQRSRQKGARLVSPNGLPVVCVTRPGPWGNPYFVSRDRESGEWWLSSYGNRIYTWRLRVVSSKQEGVIAAVEMFRDQLKRGGMKFLAEDVRRELRGKNLACWCPIGSPCHADVLLEVANG